MSPSDRLVMGDSPGPRSHRDARWSVSQVQVIHEPPPAGPPLPVTDAMTCLGYPLALLTGNVTVFILLYLFYFYKSRTYIYVKEKLFISREDRKPISRAIKRILQNKNTGNRAFW